MVIQSFSEEKSAVSNLQSLPGYSIPCYNELKQNYGIVGKLFRSNDHNIVLIESILCKV